MLPNQTNLLQGVSWSRTYPVLCLELVGLSRHVVDFAVCIVLLPLRL
jgi:hypothetical protein